MSGPYQQGPYQQGAYEYGAPTPAAPVRYAPGAGLVLGLLGLVGVALSLFALSWVDGSKGGFTDLSSAIRAAGSERVPNTALYLYGAWAGFALFGLAVVLTVLALVPIPSSAAGNTYARVGAAVVAGTAAVLHIWTMHKVSSGDTVLHVGAWLGLLGYLVLLAATIVGARRVAG